MTMSEKQFKEHYLVGFCGYSNEGDINKGTHELVAETLTTLAMECDVAGYRIMAVGGYTNSGINRILRQVCTDLNIPLAGITSGKCYDYPCWDSVDYLKVVGDNWGDESANFVDALDILVRIDGGKQSYAECDLAVANDKITLQYDYIDGAFVAS